MRWIRVSRQTGAATIALVGLLLTSCGSTEDLQKLESRANAAAAAKAIVEVKPVFPELPAKCTQKMARVHPQIGGLASHDLKQLEINADAQDSRTLFCANFYRQATGTGGVKP